MFIFVYLFHTVVEQPVWPTVAGAIPPIGAKHILLALQRTVLTLFITVPPLFSTVGHNFVLSRPPLLVPYIVE
jgi:hypothetical protein